MTCRIGLVRGDFWFRDLYNVRGQLVRTLVHEWLDAGLHEAVWHGDDDSGARVSSGVYFARLVAGQTRLSQRLVLLK